MQIDCSALYFTGVYQVMVSEPQVILFCFVFSSHTVQVRLNDLLILQCASFSNAVMVVSSLAK